LSADWNKDIVRRQFDLLNSGDVKAAARRYGRLWLSIMQASRHEDDRVGLYESQTAPRASPSRDHAARESVAVRTTCDRLHSARPEIPVNSAIFDKVEPTGRKYAIQHMHPFRIVDRKITEHWANRDDLGAARQVSFELVRANE
jgi:hypothetical protein